MKLLRFLADCQHDVTLPLGESRATQAERDISLPVAGAPPLPSESYVEYDMTFGGRVICDQTWWRSAGSAKFSIYFCFLLFGLVSSPARAQDPIDFDSQIAPILEEHCLRCHSDGDAKGDLSLTTASGLLESGYLTPRDPDASGLIDLITPSADGTAAMPQKSKPLTDSQIQDIRTWIAQGAKWPVERKLAAAEVSDRDWWSLEPIDSPAGDLAVSPAGKFTGNPVDAFIDAKLQEAALKPVPMASPRTLLRRLTYDLTGLPPTIEETEAFLAAHQADSESAWSDLVDRLLDSPEFGEKWAQHWLDVARYAETHGYDKDKPRNNAWPYRDYVIDSFNSDKPYARFIQEQVAGDALFPGDPDGVLGLGFLAAGPWDFIGHWEVGEKKLDGRIAKHLDRDEMLSAVFNVFMSTTVQCAQCHHHKFDPIRMEDYYSLHAVFAAVDRADRVYTGLPPDAQQEQRTLQMRLEELREERKQQAAEATEELTRRVAGIDRRIAELIEMHGSQIDDRYGYHSGIANDANATKWVQVDLGEQREILEVRLMAAYDNYADIGAGFGFPVRYAIQGAAEADFSDAIMLFDASQADQQNPRSRTVVVDAKGARIRYLRVNALQLAERKNDFIFALAELQALDADGKNLAKGAAVSALDSIEAPVRWAAANLTDGIYPKLVDDLDGHAELVDLQAQRAAIESELFTPELKQALARLSEQIAGVEAELAKFPPGKVVYAAATRFQGGGQFLATNGKPRAIHLLHRGDLRSPGPQMQPAAPRLWLGTPPTFESSQNDSVHADAEGRARAELALYLTRNDNPLTWRTIANRIWQWTFGQPIVGTPNDFGRMGMLPTHPELLDYLASRLRDDPQQSLKSIVRLLVTSQAYRRDSSFDAGNAAIDANNSFLWRANRRRLTAEEFRDSILAASGVLQLDARGGPSFQDFIIEKPEHSPHYQYHLYDPNNAATHRRSVYRFVVRSQPQPMLTALDCADPSISVPMRDESTTALQALTQWNDRFVEAMSRHLADRLRRAAPSGGNAMIDHACELVLGRPASAAEREPLRLLLEQHGEETLARVLFNMSAFTYVE